jgi:hypothetical protein
MNSNVLSPLLNSFSPPLSRERIRHCPKRCLFLRLQTFHLSWGQNFAPSEPLLQAGNRVSFFYCQELFGGSALLNSVIFHGKLTIASLFSNLSFV